MKNKLYILLSISIILFISITLLLNIPANYNQPHFIYPDANSYIISANLLYKHGIFHHFRPFGWPVIVGIPNIFLNNGATNLVMLQFSIIVNFCCWLGSIYFLYKIVSEYTNTKTAFTICLLFLLTLSHILLIYQSMSETIFIFFLILFAYNIQLFVKTNSYKYLSFAAFIIFYSAIIRPTNYYPALMTLFVALFLARKKSSHIVLILTAFILTIGVQLYTMQQHYGKPTLSYIKNYTANYYLFQKARFIHTGAYKNEDFDSYYDKHNLIIRQNAMLDSAKDNGKTLWPYLDDQYAKKNLEILTGMPVASVKTLLINIRGNSNTGSNLLHHLKNYNNSKIFDKSVSIISKLTKYENILFTTLFFINWIILVWFVIKRLPVNIKELAAIVVLQLLCSYYVVTSGVSFWQGDRFHYIFSPLTLIVSAYLYHNFIKKSSFLRTMAPKA